ncbi:hypothetical protein ACWEV3_23620 [Saccharopolyspora sp. NPDC003752]
MTVDDVVFHGRVMNLDEAWRRDGRGHQPHVFTCWRSQQPQQVSPVRLPDGFRFNRTGWVEVGSATLGLP